jgi:hypothetical protein
MSTRSLKSDASPMTQGTYTILSLSLFIESPIFHQKFSDFRSGALAEWLRRLTRIILTVLVSNPFGGKSSNLLGVDIFFASTP